MENQSIAFHQPADTGPAYWGPGDRYTFLVTGAQSNGAYFIMEGIIPSGGGPLHIHRREEECFYLLEGTLEITLGEKTFNATTGGFIQIPRGIVHKFHNVGSTTARMLLLFSPGGMDKYFEETLEPVQDRSAAFRSGDFPPGQRRTKTRIRDRVTPPSKKLARLQPQGRRGALHITSLLVVVALLIAGCSSSPAPATQPASTSSTSPRASAAPRPGSGLKQIDPSALQAMLDKTAKELLIPGAVILLRTPQGEFTFTYGTTLLGATIPPRVDTHFRAASNTKTMTAAIIMQLAQENKLSLDDPVSKHVPGVPNGDNITIAELLEMRSGLYNYSDAPAIWENMDRRPTKVWSPPQLLAIAFAHPPNFPPGTAYEYNNTNYALLGLIIEKVGGKPLAQAMQERLFEPLHLQHTQLPPSAVNTLPDPYSHGYLYGSASVAMVGTPPYSPQVKAAARAGTLLPKDYTDLNYSFAAAAGGVISTASDLVTWIQALVGGRVLNATSQRRWLDSPRPEDPSKPDGQQYGYGIAKLHWGPNTIYFHGGESPGFNSFMGYDPANLVTLVVWTNLTVSLDEIPTANALMLKVLDQIYMVSPLPPSQAVTHER
jgi:D-alanyl-D-alanine carboxypeptidase